MASASPSTPDPPDPPDPGDKKPAAAYRRLTGAALLALATLFPTSPTTPGARADGFGELPVAVEIRVLKYAEQELARVERVLKQQHGVEAERVANVTVPLQNYIEDELGGGAVTIYPRAVFELVLKAVRGSTKKDEIGRRLVQYQRDGRFARIARGEGE